MNNIDPDIQYALQRIGAGLEAKRVEQVHERHQLQAAAKIETLMEMLSDEVANYIPRSHQAFSVVLSLVVLRKMQRQQQEPEFHSFLDEGLPHHDW